MCGNFGFITNGLRTSGLAYNELTTGLEGIRYHGPDGTRQWVSQGARVGLGHVRLSIIDVESGSQPMHSEEGRYTIIYNGEVHNYIELRNEPGADSYVSGGLDSSLEAALKGVRKTPFLLPQESI